MTPLVRAWLSDPTYEVLVGVGAEQLAAKILEFPVTRETVAEAVRREPRDLVEHAFQTILRNRTQRGGVMARRAGLINRGERNRGVSSRGYPATLAQRIRTIDRIRGRITFIEGDGLAETARWLGRKDTDIFLDPPYVSGEAAGRRLYTHHDVDPNQVLRLAAEAEGSAPVTYADTEEIRGAAAQKGLNTRQVAMYTTQGAPKHELLIAKDLSWVEKVSR